jgi:alkanesulfonate monooxygenase
MNRTDSASIRVFSTCPPSKDVDRSAYLSNVADVARWSEAAGCEGILVYTDNSLVDPWLISQIIIESTERLCPLVAIQPVYMHPYTVATMVSSLAFLHGRRIYLNMVAGGFKNDLIALNDQTPHDDRYVRTIEYTQIIKALLSESGPSSFEGRYYKVSNLKLAPPLPAELYPGILISGSSEAGLAAAEAIGATAVKYPKPPGEEEEQKRSNGIADYGVRVGIVARANSDEAWRVAHERFPSDRKGQITHKLAMKVSDSAWHKQLSEPDPEPDEGSDENPYWLFPFQNYKTFCPYLVGSYERVGHELAQYVSLGFETFILDVPPSEEELHHIGIVFEQALGALQS